ncbi:MAG: hypothetical protein AAF658_02225 [Myxococcota bacterium]
MQRSTDIVTLPFPIYVGDGGTLATSAQPGYRRLDDVELEISAQEDRVSQAVLKAGDGTRIEINGMYSAWPNEAAPGMRALHARLGAWLDGHNTDPNSPLGAFQRYVDGELHVRRADSAPEDPALAVIWRVARSRSRYGATRAAVADEIGVMPRRWAGWIDEARELSIVRAVLNAARPQDGVSADFLYAIAIGEGMNVYLDRSLGLSQVAIEHPVRGFGEMGLDFFAAEYEQLRRFLPADYRQGTFEGDGNFYLAGGVNEVETISSANFHTLQDGLYAMSAMLADRRIQALADAEERGLQLDAEATEFYTYVYFNGTIASRRAVMDTLGADPFQRWEGPAPENNRNPRFNALERLGFVRFLRALEIFPGGHE